MYLGMFFTVHSSETIIPIWHTETFCGIGKLGLE